MAHTMYTYRSMLKKGYQRWKFLSFSQVPAHLCKVWHLPSKMIAERKCVRTSKIFTVGFRFTLAMKFPTLKDRHNLICQWMLFIFDANTRGTFSVCEGVCVHWYEADRWRRRRRCMYVMCVCVCVCVFVWARVYKIDLIQWNGMLKRLVIETIEK